MRWIGLAAVGVWLAAAGVSAAPAAEVEVAPGGLAAAVERAAPGDRLRLAAGRYAGGVVIDKTLAIEGATGATIDGGGSGRVITVDAPEVRIAGLVVANSGASLADEDAGIYLTERARRAVIEDNRLEDNLIGIYLKGAAGAVVRRNRIRGRRDLRMSERGNGVQVWNAPGARVVGNEIRYGRDGIFVTTSRDNRFADNDLRDLRFAVHYMYTQDSEVSANRSRGNHVGYVLMYSRGLTVRANLSEGDRDRGLLLNAVNRSSVEGNAVAGGAETCVFIYNANVNRFRGNWFEGCGIGIHFTAGSERNAITGNAFVGNRTQVKYVGTRDLDWSAGGRGNYWSDNPAFDLDGDGLADRPYRPNDLADRVVWAYPQAKLLLASPAMQVLRYAQSQLPALLPGGVVDSAPLMRPPQVAARRLEARP